MPEPVTASPRWAPWWVGEHSDEKRNILNMDPSLISRPGRGLNLPTSKDVSSQNADEKKGDQLIKSISDLLERGEIEIKLDEERKDVILILGNTGSGKSTFTQWIAGDNTKLISKETEEGTGEYFIEDHNRIGDSTLKSKTIFPELVVDPKTNATYYDCPGFSDTQGSSHDISTTYFIKKVLDYSEKVKMVFAISHPSVRKGVDRQDFMKLLRHVTDLVKDIEKFKNSIAIVATKVDNQYIKKGKNFVLVEDDKVVAAIASFLQEVKRYLEDNSKHPNLSEKEKRFYENAIKFVDFLLEKDGDGYPKIALFRRPDGPGPVSDIPLLQNGKKALEKIVFEKLNFTAKNNEDFGYTVSEKTKIDIIKIGEEINKNLWSRVSKIAEKVQSHYENFIDEVRCIIYKFLTKSDAINASPSKAEEFALKFNNGYSSVEDLANKLKNLTNPEELAVIVSRTIPNLDINIPEDDMIFISKQAKFFNVLQTVSDKILNFKPWEELFKNVETFLTESKVAILRDADSAVKEINNRIQLNLNSTIKDLQEEYADNIKSLDVQELSEKLSRDGRIIFEIKEEMKNGTTTEKLVTGIRYVANSLGVSSPKEYLQIIANQGNYLKFLEVIKDETLEVGPKTLLSPLENIVKYFYESEKWYSFLEDLYNKFSEYGIQKNRQRYNVADLEDWGQPDRSQGIAITSNNFEKFLDKIGSYNVTGYDAIRNLTTTGLQMEELNQVLSLTLKHKPVVRCSEPYITIKGTYVSLNETMQNIIRNTDTNNSCKNFISLLASGKYTLLNVFALRTLFIDADLSFSGKGTSVAFIAPKWEVIGSKSVDLRGADAAPNAESKAKKKTKGVPGKPGGSGESFFGIGSYFANGKSLTVSTNGGEGGRGQDGGDGIEGAPGRDAEEPTSSDPPCDDGYVIGLRCEAHGHETQMPGIWQDLCITKPLRIYGVPGGKGGDGSDGGKGGRGGLPGKLSVLQLNQKSEITKLAKGGKNGKDGRASGLARGGKDGDDIIAKWQHFIPGLYQFLFGMRENKHWEVLQTIRNYGRGPPGSKGSDGANTVGLKNPKPANGIRRSALIINEYKSYLRENLSDRFRKHYLVEFLDQLNDRRDVRELYDTLALMAEFKDLEGQLHKLKERMDFSPFYSSLLERIGEFAKNKKGDETSDDHKKVLNYMYTATLGRIYSLSENKESNLIVDIRGHMNLVKENIKNLQDLQAKNNKVDVINKYKETYKNSIDKKIEEARNFIQKQMNPEIENINKEIDNQINSLLEETITFQKQAKKEKKDLVEKKKQLENALATKGFFRSFQIIGGILSFLGPIGAIAGTVIETANTVSESLTLKNRQQTLNLPSDIITSIKSLESQIKVLKNNKVSYLNKLLNNVSEEIKKNPEKLSDMADKVAEIRGKLKKASENKIDFKQVKALEGELKRELKRKGEDLKVNSKDKKSKDASKVIDKMAEIAKFGSLMLNIHDKIKEDNEKIDSISDALGKITDKITKLKEYEENIHDTMIPMLQEMEENMKSISDKLGTKSQVGLDVTKWRVQSTLKDMRLQMQRLTEGFEVKDHLSRSIEKLNEVMTTLINIYDRIQGFQEQQNLANYVADISSVTSSSINIKNQALSNAVNQLELAIKASIVLKQYKSSIYAFKQWVFPFSGRYIEKSMLPSQLVLDKSISDLVQNATREIDVIGRKLDLYSVSVMKSDHFLQRAEFSSRYVSSQPFFVWKNEEYGNLISKLLSGKEVVLKADVAASVPRRDAIKFSVIDFHFRAKNETTQTLLHETLKAFDLRATHLGNSYYRYDNKIYLITSDSIPISYAFEKSDAGVPIRKNYVYDKLKSGDLMLSPYALWEVRVINATNKHSFRDLERFRGEIDLELSGFGSYVDKNVFAADAYKSFIAFNHTKPIDVNPKTTGVNQCTEPKSFMALYDNFGEYGGGYSSNGASSGISSPINIFCNFLKTYLISNAILPINKFFLRKLDSISSLGDRSELPEECVETQEKHDPIVMSIPGITVTAKADANPDGEGLSCKIITSGMKSGTFLSNNFDTRTSCSKPFLLYDQQESMSHRSIQVPELNCSLLLADVVARTITGNKYKSAVDECLLSPREVVLGKIRDGIVQTENDIKQNLQRHLSEVEDDKSSFWLSKLSSCAKSVFQLLGFSGKDDSDKYIQDIRNLFA